MSIGQRVPEGLAAMPPGPGLACLLAGIDPTRVANDDIVDVLAARSRQLAHDQAHMFTTLSEVIHRTAFTAPGEIRRSERPEQYGPDEVRAALAWTRRAADHETHLARTLVIALPQVHAALLHGDIDRPKAIVFARHLDGLPPAHTAAVCAAVLPHAPRLTTGQITDRIKRLIIEIDPAHYERRYRKAVRDRKVVAYLAEDGTAVLTVNGLPAEEAAAAIARIDTLSRAARRSGHPGTLDQIRADLVLGLLDGSLHHLTRDEIIEALINRYTGRDTEPDDDHSPDTTGDSDEDRDDSGFGGDSGSGYLGDGDDDDGDGGYNGDGYNGGGGGGSNGSGQAEDTGSNDDRGSSGGHGDLTRAGVPLNDLPGAGTDAPATSTESPAATGTGTAGIGADPLTATASTTAGTSAIVDTDTDTDSLPRTCPVGPEPIRLPPVDPASRDTARRFDEPTPDTHQVPDLAARDRAPPVPATVPGPLPGPGEDTAPPPV